jgi:D-glycero-D-manno-heptose 1,7-bisphosphate phosphatase
MKNGQRAVFLDRDGVLNRAIVRDGKPYPPSTLSELEIMPGAAEILAGLKQLGFLLIVVTNQPDVGRGRQKRETVDAMHDHMKRVLPLDDLFVCYHTDGDACGCRKPEPGLILSAAAKYTIDLTASYLVGDRWRDIEAGERGGCRTVLIEYGYREQGPSIGPTARVASLLSAASWIVEQNRRENAA